MLEHSEQYAAGIVEDSRWQVVRATFDLIDPDAIVEGLSTNNQSPYTRNEQVVTRGADETYQKISSLEKNRWLLDGEWEIEPVDPTERIGQVGWEGGTLTDSNGYFSQPYPYFEQEVSGITILQAVTLQFSKYDFNGYPVDFTVEIYSGGQLQETLEYTGNDKTRVVNESFEVYYPDRLRLVIKRWSISNRRVRVVRFLAGLYEEWDGDIIKTMDIYTESTFSGLAMPYSTCDLEVYNENHRFDPYAPNSIFKSIQARQFIPVDFGLKLSERDIEWIRSGVYYQQDGGWQLKDLTITWKLVDIIGMLTKRRFSAPETLPTTLGGWIASLLENMGPNFKKRFIVDDDVTNLSLAATAESVEGKFCGEILRYACMATNTWPRQDMKSGKLRVGKLERVEGNKITLDNMNDYVQMSANSEIADITFSLDEGTATFPGTNTDSDVSLTVSNPFVHTADDARKAVISCLFEYGGKSFTVRSRGNPTSETGDLMSVDTQYGTSIAARLYKQQLKIEDGVMRNMPSYLVQSPNDSLYANKEILTGSGTWTAPDGVGKIKITLISGGNGGRGGGGGIMIRANGDQWYTVPDDKEGGQGGPGGLVLVVETGINSGQSYSYSCGAGGAGGAGGQEEIVEPRDEQQAATDGEYGEQGGVTTFGVFSSANGKLYPNGLMDIQSGAVYGATGPDVGGTETGSYGCGGIGGVQGENGAYEHYMQLLPGGGGGFSAARTIVQATPGQSGGPGKPGCVIVEW